jgi:hypothetical protein
LQKRTLENTRKREEREKKEKRRVYIMEEARKYARRKEEKAKSGKQRGREMEEHFVSTLLALLTSLPVSVRVCVCC